MTKTVEFLFDFGSPTTYLAHKRLPAVLLRTGAKAKYVPILLGGVFKATGNASPAEVPAKGVHMQTDMQRFAQKYGVSLKQNPFFPINTLTLMRGAAALVDDDRFEHYVDTIFNAMWRDPKNLGDLAQLSLVLQAAGFDPAEFGRLVQDQAAKDRLKTATEDAVARGAFGAPTFFVGEQMFFGQDRLDFVEEALHG